MLWISRFSFQFYNMRKNVLLILACVCVACEGKLTDEQRKKMKEQMELHEIRRVTDTEITEAAYTRGRQIVTLIEQVWSDSARLDSLISTHGGRLRWIVPGKSNAHELEQQLVEAYLADESGGMNDNVQEIRKGMEKSDSILYTKPVVTQLPDGSERLEGIWNIWLSRKQLILAMDKK
jgi:hypothetical protein